MLQVIIISSKFPNLLSLPSMLYTLIESLFSEVADWRTSMMHGEFNGGV